MKINMTRGFCIMAISAIGTKAVVVTDMMIIGI